MAACPDSNIKLNSVGRASVNTNCDAVPNLAFAHSVSTDKYQPTNVCVGTLDYSTSACADKEAAYIASLQAEALNIAGGPVNIFPMLGVHSQGSTMDTVDANGYPITSGTPAGFNALDAFTVNESEWYSIQQGVEVLKSPAYLGFSFGTKKALAQDGSVTEQYQSPKPVLKQIGSIRITQGANRLNRATQVRVEVSNDGLNWQRLDVIKLPDTSDSVVVGIKNHAKFNAYRLVPIFFNGVASNSCWVVKQLQLLESTAVSIDNIQDFFLLENRDRSYCRSSVLVKCQYDLLDVQTELAKFGINLPQTYIFTCSFAVLVNALGRPLVVGDILELPGEIQYDTNLNPVRKWLEVTDTAWSTEGYTPNWKPQLYRFYAQPILPSVEHKDILGLPGVAQTAITDDDFLSGLMVQNTQAYKATEAIKQEINDNVPLTGGDPTGLQSAMPLLGFPGGFDGNDQYVGDAIPPNNAAYTVGDQLPRPSDIQDGHYHRQTYTMIAAAIRPAERLLRWNATTQRWSVVEVNSRTKYESHKRTISSIMGSNQQIAPNYRPST
jgi:hypothetical protein